MQRTIASIRIIFRIERAEIKWQLTFKHWRSGSEALFVCPAGDAFRI